MDPLFQHPLSYEYSDPVRRLPPGDDALAPGRLGLWATLINREKRDLHAPILRCGKGTARGWLPRPISLALGQRMWDWLAMSDHTTLLVQCATPLTPPDATLKPSSRTLHQPSHCRNIPAVLTTLHKPLNAVSPRSMCPQQRAHRMH
jgi:hypothetical protein